MACKNPISKAKKLAGGSQAALAKLAGVSQQQISKYEQAGRVSVRIAVQLENLFPGEFDKRELRPDIFGTKENSAAVPQTESAA